MAQFFYCSDFCNVHYYQKNLAWFCCTSLERRKASQCSAVSQYCSWHMLQLYTVIVLFCNSILGCFRDFIPTPTPISLWCRWTQAILILFLMYTVNKRCFPKVFTPPGTFPLLVMLQPGSEMNSAIFSWI